MMGNDRNRAAPWAYSMGVAAALWMAGFASKAEAADWPQFRGPDGQGRSSERNLPLEWTETENIAWRSDIPGLGWSSPVVSGNRIWLTTAVEAEGSLQALALDRRTGEELVRVEVFRKPDLGRINAKNSHASPTAVVDGDHVFVHFGAHGTACLTNEGQIVWRVELPYNHHHGPGGSPVVWRDLLIVNCDGMDKQYVVALDKRTGRGAWRADREGKMAFTTPLVIRTAADEQLISSGGDGVYAYDPATGNERWRCLYEGHSVIPRPVYGDGLVHICSGYWTPTLYSIRVDGQGDITKSHVQSTFRRGVPFTPSPLLIDRERLLLISDRGVATCINPRNGEEHWKRRIAGNYSASPILADGRIYLLSEEGVTTVLSAAGECQELAKNALPGVALATPAMSDGAIFLRNDKSLYCIRESRGGADVATRPEPGKSAAVSGRTAR